MKRHPDHDTLLKYALQTLSAGEAGKIRKHVGACRGCRARVERLEREIGLLGSIRPQLSAAIPPLPRKSMPWPSVWLRAAAILVVGFLLGLSTAQFVQPRPVDVVEQYVVPQPPEATSGAAVSCAPIDLPTTLR